MRTSPGPLNDRRPVRLLWGIAGLAFLVRLGAAIATDGLRHPELNEYDSIAKALINGQGFIYPRFAIIYDSYAPPMYSWISAASYWLTGSIVPAMLLQLVAGSAVALIAAAIAWRVFGGWIAPAAAGALVAVHPGLVVYTATKAHPLTFDALFFSWTAWQLFRLDERPTLRRSLEFGAIVGVGTLSRGTLIIFLPIGAAWLLFALGSRSWRVAVRNGVAAGVCAAAIIAPWTIRSSLLHGRFVFLLTTDAEDFWRGNNPYATGHSYIDSGHIVLDTLTRDERRELESLPNEVAQADWFMARAKAFIYSNPRAFVRLTALKFLHFWWYAPQTGVRYAGSWFWLYMAYYVVALLLAALGAWTIAQTGGVRAREGALIAIFLLALSGLQSLYYVEGRHRWAIEPLLLAVSGGGVAKVLERRTRQLA